MCKVGDIIVVNKYMHSFVVIDDNPDSICGLDYTMVTTVISSFKSEKQRKKKLSYMENVEVVEFKKNGKTRKFAKPSYIKADKLFYFDKNKLDYYVFGRISEDLLAEYDINDKIIIGQVGTIKPMKNQEFSIRLCAKLQKPYEMFFIGAGVQKEILADKCKTDPHIHFLGLRSDVGALMRKFDKARNASIPKVLKFLRS